jgi:hypothetical protein
MAESGNTRRIIIEDDEAGSGDEVDSNPDIDGEINEEIPDEEDGGEDLMENIYEYVNIFCSLCRAAVHHLYLFCCYYVGIMLLFLNWICTMPPIWPQRRTSLTTLRGA